MTLIREVKSMKLGGVVDQVPRRLVVKKVKNQKDVLPRKRGWGKEEMFLGLYDTWLIRKCGPPSKGGDKSYSWCSERKKKDCGKLL